MERTEKGQSLLTFLDDYVVFDIETTGLAPLKDSIIEISAIRVQNNKITDTFTSLINPVIHIPYFITELTGITDDMVKNAPGISTVLPQFIEFIGDSILVGHNVNFDVNFVYDYSVVLLKETITNNFVDTMRIARRILPSLANHKLNTIAKHYRFNTEGEHRSLKDCELTHKCYQKMKKYALEHGIELEPKKGPRKSKYSDEFKAKIRKEYRETELGYQKLADKYNVSYDTIKSIITSDPNKDYLLLKKRDASIPIEKKQQIRSEYWSTNISYKKIGEKYGLSEKSVAKIITSDPEYQTHKAQRDITYFLPENNKELEIILSKEQEFNIGLDYDSGMKVSEIAEKYSLQLEQVMKILFS